MKKKDYLPPLMEVHYLNVDVLLLTGSLFSIAAEDELNMEFDSEDPLLFNEEPMSIFDDAW